MIVGSENENEIFKYYQVFFVTMYDCGVIQL